MKYDVLKNVIIDGASFAAGSVVEINHDKTDRLVNLGYIAPRDESKSSNRSVGLSDSAEKPKRRGRPPKKVEVVEEAASDGITVEVEAEDGC